MKKIIYISGSISQNKHYKRDFKRAERKLKRKGWAVFSPTRIPAIFDYEAYLDIDLAALRNCDAIFMLNGWDKSNGARREFSEAMLLDLPAFYENTGYPEAAE